MKEDRIKFIMKLVPLLMAVISYTFIHTILYNKFYSFIPSMLFIVLVVLFYNNDYNNKVMKKETLVLSSLFALLISYGELLKPNFYSNINTFTEFFKIEHIMRFIAYFNMLYLFFNNTLPKLYKWKLKDGNYQNINYVLIFSVSFSIILLCWFPYCLRFFPGLVTNDSMDSITLIVHHLKGINNHHPVFFTLFAYLPIMIGKVKFGSISTGVAIYTLIQMFTMASIFASSIIFLYKRNVNKYAIFTVLLCYALVPVYAMHSVIMWKDVLFGGLFLLLTLQMIRMAELYNKNELTLKKLISFIIIAILCALFRNNAIFMLMIVFVICLFIFKKKRKVVSLAFGIVIITYFVITGPGYKLFGVRQTETTEYISIPIQQVARIVHKGVPLTLEEEKLINKVMPIETLKRRYRPEIVDTIKWYKDYDAQAIEKNKFKYFKLWFGLCLRHPQIALEANAASTLGYWYPNIIYWYNPLHITNEKYDVYVTSKAGEKTTDIIDKTLNSDSTIFNIEWNIALWLYIALVFGVISYKKKKWIGVVPYLPLFGLWFTLIIATPVYAEFRYIFGAFTAMPILIIYPYLKK